MNRRSEIIRTAFMVAAVVCMVVSMLDTFEGNASGAAMCAADGCFMLLCSIIVKLEWL